MLNLEWNKKFMSMFLILLSLFVFIFFTQWYYSNLISTMELNSEKEKTLSEKIKESGNLSITKKDLEKEIWEKSELIQKYSNKLEESEFIKEIYSSVDKSIENGGMKILSLSMTEWVKNELWFIESKVNISARFTNKQVMKDFINYLTYKSKYKFFITNFNMPKIEEGKNFNTNIPLTLFYVDVK